MLHRIASPTERRQASKFLCRIRQKPTEQLITHVRGHNPRGTVFGRAPIQQSTGSVRGEQFDGSYATTDVWAQVLTLRTSYKLGTTQKAKNIKYAMNKRRFVLVTLRDKHTNPDSYHKHSRAI